MSFQNFDQIINLKVKIITLLDQIIIGQIYTYSSSNEIIIIKTKTNTNDNKQNSSSTSTYRIYNTAFIKSIQVLPPFSRKNGNNKSDSSSSSSSSSASTLLEFINMNDLDKRLKREVNNYKPQPIQQQQASHTQPSNISTLLFNRLVKLYGDKNVKFGNGNNSTTSTKQSEIIIFNEIKIIKPFTNIKSNIQIIKENGKKHLDSIQRALNQFWLEIDNEKRGG
ncbi:conserved hypothetical protein [Candida albicans WO-1]|uniref:Uncharacterized protein n=1 Tax=Candida albicans (strain WO-1) TaxID=294748 RepID=C4YTV9_CANAW|nr:conserved hypothetical protein [Candida albicans WO-1]